ncbi:MAG: carotenoid biosynthesis protein [Verrucomicrobia bacterium]|nr:carotenoid biosynthesis protein [Verrucomicrobiota bacterium]
MEPSEKTLNRTAQALLVLLLAGLILVVCLARGTPAAPWQLGLLLGLAVVSTLVSLGRALQLQNVLTVATLIVIIAGIVQTVGVATSIPFGPLVFTDNLGEQLFDKLPWTAPLLWVVILLNCRGVARLILRPWRKLHGYGFRVMGLTCLLTALFDLGLEPFATRVHRFWIWRVSGGVTGSLGAPWVNFLGWAVTALIILLVATPWLINKQPGKRRPPDFHPLIVWLALNLFLATTLALHQLWLPAGITLAVAVAGTISAWRNAT